METTIGWTGTPSDGLMLTGYTFNPWWGCVKVSPACKHCYAETLAKRFRYDVWGKDAPRREFGDKHWNEPLKWNKLAGKLGIRQKVFTASMADWAEDNPALLVKRAALFDLIRKTPNLNWLLLTKRCDENLHKLLPYDWGELGYPNVWLGTTCENQEEANKRIPHLLNIPAAVHFVSAEPLLGYIDFERIPFDGFACNTLTKRSIVLPRRIDWIIVGGESGNKARPMHCNWAANIRDQCKANGVEFFFKQWGQWQEGSNVKNHDYVGEHIVMLDDGRYEADLAPNLRKEIPTDKWNAMAPQVMAKVGTKKAGRVLDDITHDGMPTQFDKIK